LFLPLFTIFINVICQAVSVGENTNIIDIETILCNAFSFCNSCNIFGLNSVNEWLFDNIIIINSNSNLMLSNCLGFVIWYYEYSILVYFMNLIFRLFVIIPELIEKVFKR
jgi:hypothetical protein